ncbi:unnamed protein product [Schistosoma turkestanicum]|nr:unnamed protein product [Schistosoma turkestanicum]
MLLHLRKKPQNITVKGDVQGHNQISKCEKLSSQTEEYFPFNTGKSKSPDFRDIPMWLQKSVKSVQNCFRERPPKLTDNFTYRTNCEDGNASPNTFKAIHKSLKKAKANISGNLEEIFSKLGLEQWIEEYKNANNESMNKKSFKDQQIAQNLTRSWKNERSQEKRLRKESSDQNPLQGQTLSTNVVDDQSEFYSSDSGKQYRDEQSRFLTQDKLNISFPLSPSDKIQNTSLDFLSVELFDKLQENNSINSRSSSINDKGFSQIEIHDRPTVLKNNHHEYPLKSRYPRSSCSFRRCLNDLTIGEKQNYEDVLKRNTVTSNNINFDRVSKKGYEFGPDIQKIHRWLDENPYLMSDYTKNKRKHTLTQKSDTKYVHPKDNIKYTASPLNIISPPIHPIWDTPEDLRTSTLTDFLRF